MLIVMFYSVYSFFRPEYPATTISSLVLLLLRACVYTAVYFGKFIIFGEIMIFEKLFWRILVVKSCHFLKYLFSKNCIFRKHRTLYNSYFFEQTYSGAAHYYSFALFVLFNYFFV